MTTLTDTLKSFVEHLGSAYFVYAGLILLVCGLPWLFIRRRVSNPDVRRLCSSLIVALAFAPSMIAGDLGGITVPAVMMIWQGFIGHFAPPLVITAGTILLLCGLLFIARSFLAICYSRRRRNDA
jgi:hypothetical protein